MLRIDASGLVRDPFARAVLYLHRGDWLLALGDSTAAQRAWLWSDAWDVEGWPQGGAQAGEVDAALSALARLRRAGLALARGPDDEACRLVSRVRELWADAELALAAPRGSRLTPEDLPVGTSRPRPGTPPWPRPPAALERGYQPRRRHVQGHPGGERESVPRQRRHRLGEHHTEHRGKTDDRRGGERGAPPVSTRHHEARHRHAFRQLVQQDREREQESQSPRSHESSGDRDTVEEGVHREADERRQSRERGDVMGLFAEMESGARTC